jgi:hypothetical protein
VTGWRDGLGGAAVAVSMWRTRRRGRRDRGRGPHARRQRRHAALQALRVRPRSQDSAAAVKQRWRGNAARMSALNRSAPTGRLASLGRADAVKWLSCAASCAVLDAECAALVLLEHKPGRREPGSRAWQAAHTAQQGPARALASGRRDAPAAGIAAPASFTPARVPSPAQTRALPLHCDSRYMNSCPYGLSGARLELGCCACCADPHPVRAASTFAPALRRHTYCGRRPRSVRLKLLPAATQTWMPSHINA